MRSVVTSALLLFFSPLLLAQTKSSAASPISYEKEAVVAETSETLFRYAEDGTGEKIIHLKMKIQNEAGVRQFSVLSVAYASANESAHVQSLRVLHADGTSTETPATDAIDMPSPVTQQAPFYSDLKVQQIPVRGLRVGDTLDYRVAIQRKNPESPGQFWDKYSFTKDGVVLAETLTLEVPADKYVQVWCPTMKPTVREDGGRRVYEWSGSQLKPTPPERKSDETEAEPEKKPHVAWTTFHTWQEVGEWYRNLAAPRMVVTDGLRAQAEEITRQATTPEAQVQAIYSFVATRIRYIGVDFGVGRYQPHAPAEVLANQYGDCKDKDTLLETLLRAKGFDSAPALIGVNIDMVPEVPSPGFFNHVITTVTLPTGRMWMDTSPEIAPFQLLVLPLRDKEALLIPPSGAASLERTPAKTPFSFVDRFEAVAALNTAGELTGHVEINYRSDSEILVRSIARTIAPAQWDQGTQAIANLMGFSGKTSNSSFARADETSAPMHVSYDYEKHPFGDWDNYRIIPLFPLTFLPVAPEKGPEKEIDLGAVRSEIAISRIRLPENFSADLPDAVHVKSTFATFDKTYKLQGGELIAEKTLVVLQSKVPAASWMLYKKFVKDMGEEGWIQLTTKSAVGNGPHPPKPGENNPKAATLVSEASDLEKRGNWDGALQNLDEAKAIAPEQPFLWSNYGFIAMVKGKSSEARAAFRRELELHPDESYVVTLYAGFLSREGDKAEAKSVLTNHFKTHPSEAQVAIRLAALQAETSNPEAIATIRRALDSQPDDRTLKLNLCDYLIRDKQVPEASALAKKQLEAAEDAETLNAFAYLLAQAGTDLPLAEQSTRKALELLDAHTSGSSVSEANARSFMRTASLAATWDTLGFILMKESKLDEALDYLEAAWRNDYGREVGEHYGRALEAAGERKAALRIYELASNTPHMDFRPNVDLASSISRLKKVGVPSTVDDATQILQKERSAKIKLKSPRPKYSSATFRVQFAADSTFDVMRVNGDPALEIAVESIKALRFPHMVPKKSNARILRDAILSCSGGATTCEFVLTPIVGNMVLETVGD